jgi:hypothetical protein
MALAAGSRPSRRLPVHPGHRHRPISHATPPLVYHRRMYVSMLVSKGKTERASRRQRTWDELKAKLTTAGAERYGLLLYTSWSRSRSKGLRPFRSLGTFIRLSLNLDGRVSWRSSSGQANRICFGSPCIFLDEAGNCLWLLGTSALVVLKK